MEHSWRLINNISGIFNRNNAYNEGALNGVINVTNNNVLNRYISIDVSTTEVEIPIICYDVVKSTMEYYFNPERNNETNPVNPIVNIPLFEGNSLISTVATSAINSSIKRGYRQGLCKVVTTKNVYYMGKGIIFDQDYKLLMLTTIVVKLTNTGIVIFRKEILYIDPTVFSRGDMISNFIIKKMIPICTTNDSDITDYVIKDMNHWIKVPIEPTVKDIEEKNISKFVKANSENIIRELFNKIQI